MQIKVKVKPKAKKQEANKISKNQYDVSVKEPAEDYKANVAVIKVMKKELRKGIKMISGFKSKEKILEVSDANKI